MSDRILGPKQLEERGLAGIFGQPPLAGAPAINPPQEGLMMAQLNFNRAMPGGEYVPEEDVIETLPDGRTIQVAVKGVPISMSDAIKAGLVKESKSVGPSESKPQAGPSEGKPEAGATEAKAEEAPATESKGKK